jgi:membrane associated rhomboid family serine protease
MVNKKDMQNVWRGRFGLPPVVFNLLIINVAAWLVVQLAILTKNPPLNAVLDSLMLFPAGSGLLRPWQLVTYMFMHGGFWHLLLNMWPLWMFGRVLEYELGSKRFLLYYMVCGIGAGLVQLLVNYLLPPGAPTLGASGAVFGILLAFGMLHPNDRIGLIFPPVMLKAKWFVMIYGAIELFAGIGNSFNRFDNVAHFAHLGGMLFGFMLLWYWKKRNKIYRYY